MWNSAIWLVALTLLLAFSAVLLILQDRKHREQMDWLNQQFLSLMELQNKVAEKKVGANRLLIDKAMSLLASADPLAYQAIQAMQMQDVRYPEPVDPDEYVDTIFRAGKEDELSGEERTFIEDIYNAPGNEFWPVGGTDTAS